MAEWFNSCIGPLLLNLDDAIDVRRISRCGYSGDDIFKLIRAERGVRLPVLPWIG